MTWRGSNFGAGLKAVAEAIEADRPAFIHGDRIVSWGEFDRLTDNIAANLLAHGLKPGDVAGQHLRNCPEYMISWFACAKAGVIPVNINYHYKPAELRDIFQRFGINALFTQKEFAPLAEKAIEAMDAAPFLIQSDGEDWTNIAETPASPEFHPCDDPDALIYVATGGTTGMPKAVMWPHVDAWDAFKISTWQRGLFELPWVAETLGEHAQRASPPDTKRYSAVATADSVPVDAWNRPVWGNHSAASRWYADHHANRQI
jgi:fatty-acyl-CoA synthase